MIISDSRGRCIISLFSRSKRAQTATIATSPTTATEAKITSTLLSKIPRFAAKLGNFSHAQICSDCFISSLNWKCSSARTFLPPGMMYDKVENRTAPLQFRICEIEKIWIFCLYVFRLSILRVIKREILLRRYNRTLRLRLQNLVELMARGIAGEDCFSFD